MHLLCTCERQPCGEGHLPHARCRVQCKPKGASNESPPTGGSMGIVVGGGVHCEMKARFPTPITSQERGCAKQCEAASTEYALPSHSFIVLGAVVHRCREAGQRARRGETRRDEAVVKPQLTYISWPLSLSSRGVVWGCCFFQFFF